MVENFFSICLNSFVVINQKDDANFARDELRNFPTKFGLKFTTSFRSSRFNCQLRNENAKYVAIFRNSQRTSEIVCQKFCETHCNFLVQYTQFMRSTYSIPLRGLTYSSLKFMRSTCGKSSKCRKST